MLKFSFKNIKIIPLVYIAFVLCTTGLPLYSSGCIFMKRIAVKSPKNGIKYAIVDDKDYILVSQFKWTLTKRRGNQFRAEKGETKESPYGFMHRLIMGITDKNIIVDHTDKNNFNNQRQNLRICTSQQNSWNRGKHKKTSSKYLGVAFSTRQVYNKRKRGVILSAPSPAWRASIHKDRKRIHLGWFKKEKDAAKAYNEAAVKLFGEFASLNKI